MNKLVEINKGLSLDSESIGYDEDAFECNLDYSIYTDKNRKINALINTGICPQMAEFSKVSEIHTLAILKSLEVDEKERGNGYGKELMDEFLSDVDSCSAIAVLVADTMQFQSTGLNLIEFYKSFGFVAINETEYYDDSQSDTCTLPVMIRHSKAVKK